MIYLDNAATTYPKPRGVLEGSDAAMRMFGANPGRGGHDLSQRAMKVIYDVRESLCKLFMTNSPERVILTSNCTGALNLAIKGTLSHGDHIITSSLEHNSVIRPIHSLYKKGMITYNIAAVYEDEEQRTLESFKELIKPETKMIAVTAASNVTGVMLPLKKLGMLCKERGLLFLVDAAQIAGIYPMNVNELHIDYLCMPGHKGLYGPMGTGALIIGDRAAVPRPLMEGGTGGHSFSLVQPDVIPEGLESGTLNLGGFAGLLAGIEFVKGRGVMNIYNEEMSLAAYAYDRLKSCPNVTLYAKRPLKSVHTGTISFNVKGLGSEEVAEILNDNSIAVRAGFHCSPLAHTSIGTQDGGTVRISFGAFNTKKEIDALYKVIRNIS